ncbi:ribosomal protein S18-alanine N-acetyltransferase [Lacrimispora sp.]|uniref:ribosomal protein S18-alanine N-acetyltransferase n=1 Tax=Lacrimispora sp. TaxID=2719234 RepID=UPI0028AF469B|nr:ribosomal protein S18-alanine N-acetyltransferase [Lacrimispora sp.]
MFIIREMMEEDILPISEIEGLSFSDPWSYHTIKDGKNSRYDTWLVLLQDDMVMGYLVLRVIAFEGELLRIALRPECRGRGLAKKLMDQLVEYSKNISVESLFLEVRYSNEKARNLYRSYDFKETSIRKNYYRNPQEDAVVMWLRLT